MTTSKLDHLDVIHSIRNVLLQLLEGMDYCLDWKPGPDEWSVREIIYHLVDTPRGGLHNTLKGMVSGELKEYEIVADQSNITPERLEYDIDRVRQDVLHILQEMENTLNEAREADLNRPAVAHLITRGRDEVRTGNVLLTGTFARHWREHLGQIRELRDTLGV